MGARRTIIDGQLRCTKCQKWKPVDLFYRRRDTACGRMSRCKSCQMAIDIARHRERYKTDKAFKTKKLAQIRRWEANNKEHYQQYHKEYQKEYRRECHPTYIRHMLSLTMQLPYSEIPKPLVEAKRFQMLIKRELESKA